MKIPRKSFEADVPAMAMGDIAFLLLIFFVLLARASDDSHIVWEPAEAPELEPSGNALASIAVDGEEKTYLNGQQIDPSTLSSALGQLLGDRQAGDRKVLIKIDKEARASAFEPVIEAVSVSGGELYHILDPEADSAP